MKKELTNKIICVVGMPGSGKSIVSDELVKQGFAFLRFGQITLDKVKEQGLKPNESNERKIREDFRKKYGMANTIGATGISVGNSVLATSNPTARAR